MQRQWSNWSGSLKFSPNTVASPDTEEALADLVRRAGDEGGTVRAVGAGHSSSPLVETKDVLISLEKFRVYISPAARNKLIQDNEPRGSRKPDLLSRTNNCKSHIYASFTSEIKAYFLTYEPTSAYHMF